MIRPSNRQAIIRRDLGDGMVDLKLGIGEIIRLEEEVGANIAAIFLRIMSQNWSIRDVISTIRLGLIGGGMAPPQASQTVDRLVQPGYLDWYWPIATDIVHAAVQGAPGDDQAEDADDVGEP